MGRNARLAVSVVGGGPNRTYVRTRVSVCVCCSQSYTVKLTKPMGLVFEESVGVCTLSSCDASSHFRNT